MREVMLVGTAHEMTNMYTMDGPELLMTHDCAMGNDNRIAFKPARVGNLTAADQMYMGEMTIEFVDANHIKQHWHSLNGGESGEHDITIELTRRQ